MSTSKSINNVDGAALVASHEPQSPAVYSPRGAEFDVQTFLKRRIGDLKEARKAKLPGIARSIEEVWSDADREYPPHELGFTNQRSRFESDDLLGMRSKLVKVGSDEEWQSNAASPDFFVKVNTALSILTDQNPEAVFTPTAEKYRKNTELAYGLWKHSWEKTGAKQQLKLFIFNLARYGTSFGKTYPRIVEIEKKVRKEYYPQDPSRDVFETRRIVKFNDLCRRALNPWQVWVSEMSRMGDPLSIDDWYYEEEYSRDRFEVEYPAEKFPNAKLAVASAGISKDASGGEVKAEAKKVETIKVGFYENQQLDIYAVWLPDQDIVLYASPLPNDDGKLSLWMSQWALRDDRSIYGIGLYEILKQDDMLFNRLFNMTMDQLTLSIYKMFFHKGFDQLGQNGRLVISPGKGEQVSDPQNIKFMEVPGPGAEAWNGLRFLQERKNDLSGVPQQLSGKFAGRTLGQDLQAKETALERMKTPLGYILDALEEEAYISLSWMKQILSIPEVLEWATPEDLEAALKETGMTEEEVAVYMEQAQTPQDSQELFFQDGQQTMDEQGNVTEPKKFANVYPEVQLGLKNGDNGVLLESVKDRFFRFGVHIPTARLDWRGIVRVNPQSILAPSREIEKRTDLDLFNLIFPSIQAMAKEPSLVPVLMNPIKEIIRSFDKDLRDWINEEHFQKLYEDSQQPQEQPPQGKMSLNVSYVDLGAQMNPVQKQVMEKYFGIKVEDPLFIQADQQNLQGAMDMGGGAVSSDGGRPDEGKAPQGIQPVARIGNAPKTLGGAAEGAVNLG